MKKILFLIPLLVAMLMGSFSHAAVEVMRRDIKLPTQKMLESWSVDSPATASATALADGLSAAATASLYEVTNQPDVARNVVVTPAGTTNDIAAGDVVVTGLSINGDVISETFTFLANATEAQTGDLAFAQITSVSVPAGDSPFGGEFDIGTGTKLGLHRCMDGAGYLIKGLVDGVALTGVTTATSATSAAANTVIPDPAPNGTRNFEFLFVQNFRCGA